VHQDDQTGSGCDPKISGTGKLINRKLPKERKGVDRKHSTTDEESSNSESANSSSESESSISSSSDTSSHSDTSDSEEVVKNDQPLFCTSSTVC